MPGLYRSKSVRRFDATNNFLTNLIEKDNVKILATASAQLFISTPQVNKWFKSSTGTICFLKDFNHSSMYYFRLYSLMQGLLWDQEMKTPFEYRRESNLFHYLRVDRFNYGFKFICEDESERFFNVVSKFSKHQTQCQSDSSSSTIKDTNTHHSQSELLDRTATFSSSNSCLQNDSNDKSTSRLSRKLTSQQQQHHHQNSSSLSSSNTNDDTKARRARRPAYSTDRKISDKKKIEKSDISCPFRCSCNDLTDSVNEPPTNPDLVKKFSTVVKQLNTFQKQTKHKQNDVADVSHVTKFVQASTVRVSTTDRKDNSMPSLIVDEDDRETLFVKQLLYQRNLPPNDELIKQVRKYVVMYGEVDRFKYILEHDHNERNKLNAFIAATKALTESKEKTSPRMNTMLASKPTNLSHVVENDPGIRMSVLNDITPINARFTPASYPTPPASNLNSPSMSHQSSGQASTMLSRKTNVQIKGKHSNLTTPTSTHLRDCSVQQEHHRLVTNLNQNSPVSTISAETLTTRHMMYQYQPSTYFEHTPVKAHHFRPSNVNNNTTNTNHSNFHTNYRTPSPARHNLRNDLNNLNSSVTPSLEANAPPKPPRRSSLRTND